MKKYIFFFAFTIQASLCMAQTPVAVRDEPKHHNVFENAFVRVLDVHIKPGDTTLLHKHETPSVFIVFHPVKTGSQVIVEEQKATALAGGSPIAFEGFYTSPRIHRVWNEDTIEYHVMDIEMLNQQQHLPNVPINEAGFEMLFDEKPVRGYRLTLPAGENLRLQRQSSLLIVALTNSAAQGASVNEKPFSKEGDFLFVPAGKEVRFANKGKQAYPLAVLEIK